MPGTPLTRMTQEMHLPEPQKSPLGLWNFMLLEKVLTPSLASAVATVSPLNPRTALPLNVKAKDPPLRGILDPRMRSHERPIRLGD